jgi:protein-L-isoaspartate(D-aspartate) O-methyltransferase
MQPFLQLSATLSIATQSHQASSWDFPVAEINTTGTQAPEPVDRYTEQREAMIEKQLRRRGVKDERVLQAMATVPRHEFVPSQFRDAAYSDEPLGIGGGQTISQPYIVASMSAALGLSGSEKVLEIGTGSGYQAAILSLLAREVCSVEFRPELAKSAAERLQHLGFHNVHVHCGDGSMGLRELAPFEAILIAAAAPSLPQPLLEQLSDHGRLIAPIGPEEQQTLVLVTRHGNEYVSERREGCRFVPLVGRHGWKDWD